MKPSLARPILRGVIARASSQLHSKSEQTRQAFTSKKSPEDLQVTLDNMTSYLEGINSQPNSEIKSRPELTEEGLGNMIRHLGQKYNDQKR